MTAPQDPEVVAAGAIVRALDPLPPTSQNRVVAWMVDRYSTPDNEGLTSVLSDVNLAMWTKARLFSEAATRFFKRCPVCAGKGELPANESGFRPRCGACYELRDLVARGLDEMPDSGPAKSP